MYGTTRRQRKRSGGGHRRKHVHTFRRSRNKVTIQTVRYQVYNARGVPLKGQTFKFEGRKILPLYEKQRILQEILMQHAGESGLPRNIFALHVLRKGERFEKR